MMKVSAGQVAMAVALSAACSLASAKIYMCKDASGRTLSSDQPIPECANKEMKEMGSDGVVRRTIAAPLTPEEKKKKEAEEERKKTEAAAQEEKRKTDRALMARYNNETDIQNARRRSLEISEDAIKREQVSMEASQKRLDELEAQMDGIKKKNGKPPAILQSKIDVANHEIDQSKKLIQEQQQEIAQTNAKFDETLKRYREITAASK